MSKSNARERTVLCHFTYGPDSELTPYGLLNEVMPTLRVDEKFNGHSWWWILVCVIMFCPEKGQLTVSAEEVPGEGIVPKHLKLVLEARPLDPMRNSEWNNGYTRTLGTYAL